MLNDLNAVVVTEETMNDDNRQLFERVARKMGWMDKGGLDTAEKKVCGAPRAYGRTRDTYLFYLYNLLKTKH